MTGGRGDQPSLERLVEGRDLGLEILHPGGLGITGELATLCQIGPDSSVLDVASGTGETACHLQETVGCQVVGVDASAFMIARAKKKARARGLTMGSSVADAHHLPFTDDTFDAVISECTLCALEKEVALREMVRVAKAGGYVGMHDLCWTQGTPPHTRDRLAELEGEQPETLECWKRLFAEAGLGRVMALDRSSLMSRWVLDLRQELGLAGQCKVFLQALRAWGISGVRRIWESVRTFQGPHAGYSLIVGHKPSASEWQ